MTPSYRLRDQIPRAVLASAVSIALDDLGASLLVAIAFGFTLGTVLNYFLAIAWVFGHGSIRDRRLEFLAFASAAVFGLALNGALMLAAVNLCAINPEALRPLVGASVFFINFAIRRFLVFARGKE